MSYKLKDIRFIKKINKKTKRIISRKKDTKIIEINFDNWSFFNFVHKNHRKIISIGISVFVVVLFFVILSFNLKADVAKANLYASSCLGTWQNSTQAEGIRDVPEGESYFTKANSAFASGNNLQIYCGGFRGDTPPDAVPRKFTVKLSWLLTANAILPTENIENQIVPENNSPTNITTPLEENSTPNSSGEVILPIPDENISSENIPIPEQAPEVIPEPSPTPEVIPEPSPAPEENNPAPVSFFDKIFSFAYAQENPIPPAEIITPSTEEIITPPAEIITPSTEEIITPPAEIITPPTEEIITPPVETIIPTENAPVSETSVENIIPSSEIDSAIPPIDTPTQVVTLPVDDLVEIFYTLDGTDWKSLGKVNAENWQNGTFEITDPNINKWEDLSNLQISVHTLPIEGTPPVIYLDSVFLEVEYENIPPVELPDDLPKVLLKDSANIDVVPNDLDFNSNDSPNFIIVNPDLSQGEIEDLIREDKAEVISDPTGVLDVPVKEDSTTNIPIDVAPVSFLSNKINLFSALFKKNFKTEKAFASGASRISDVAVFDEMGNQKDIGITLATVIVDGVERQKIILDKPSRQFRPGRYKLKITLDTQDVSIISEQNFNWGVLTLNSDRSIYRQGDNAYLQMGVLDEYGHTICDADLNLIITDPDGQTYNFDTGNGITRNPECGPDNYVLTPDYYAHFNIPNKIGTYQTSLTANTKNGTYVIHDSFNVITKTLFDVVRVAPTRINPIYNYSTELNIVSVKKFKGRIIETVPISFDISQKNGSVAYNNIQTDEINKIKTISWDVDLAKGEQINIGYNFDAPDISPEIFSIGPLRFFEEVDGVVVSENTVPTFQELREWKIASDAVCNSAATGNWATAGTWAAPCNVAGGPIAGDAVTILAGHVVTVGANAAAASVTINTPAATANGLTVSSTFTLTLTGALTQNTNTGTAGNTVRIKGTGKIIAGSVAVGGTSSTGSNLITGLVATVCSGAGGLFVNGNITIAGGTASTGTSRITMGACSATATGTIGITGGTGGSGTRIFSTTSGTISSGGATTVTSGTTGTATLSATTGTLSAAGFNIVGGTVNSLVTVTGAGGNLTTTSGVTFSGTVLQAKLTISNVAATFNNTGTISAGGTVSIGAASTTKFTGTSAINGAYTIAGSVQVNSGILSRAAVGITISGTTLVADGATLELNGAAATFTGLVTLGSGGSGATLYCKSGASCTGTKTFTAGITSNANSVFNLDNGTVDPTIVSFGGTALSHSGTTFTTGTGTTVTITGTGALAINGTSPMTLGGSSTSVMTVPTNRAVTINNTAVTIGALTMASPTAANSVTLATGTTTNITGALTFTANTTANLQTITLTGTARLNVGGALAMNTVPTSTGGGRILCAASSTTAGVYVTGASGIRNATTAVTGTNIVDLTNCSAGVFDTTGLLTITGGTSGTAAAELKVAAGGTITARNGITFATTLTMAKITTTGAATINLTGTVTGAGTLSLTAGTVLKTTGTTAINAAFTTWKNWDVVSGTTTLGAAQTVTGLWVESGAVLAGSTFLMTNTCAGTGVGGFDIDGTYSGSGGTTLNTAGCTIDGTGSVTNTGTITLTNDKTVASTANITFGAVAATAPLTVTAGTVINNGIVTIASTGTGAGLTGAGAWTQATGSTLNTAGATTTAVSITTFDASTNVNTVNYNGAAQTADAVKYSTLSLSGSGAKTVTGITTIYADFNMSGSATATPVITTVGGDVNISGTAIMTTGAGNVVTGNLSIGSGSKLTMGNFALSIGGTTDITGTLDTFSGNIGNRTFTGAVTVNNGGTWNLSTTNPAIFFEGGLTVNSTSTFISGSGVYTFQTNAQNIGGTQIYTITNITNNITTGNGLTFTGAQPTTTTLIQGTNAILTFAGTVPTITTLTATANPNNVQFTGATQSIKATTYHNLVVNGTGTATLAGTTIANGTIKITGGTFDTNSNTLTASEIVINGGTFTPQNSTVNLSGTSGVLFTKSSGTFTSGGSTFNLSGTSGTPTVASGTPSFYNLSITGAGGAPALGEALTATNDLKITAGTLTTANNTIDTGTIIVNGGTFTPGSSTINLTGTGVTLYTFSSGTITSNTAPINLTGNGAATVASGTPVFYSLTSSGTGTKSLGETLTITGDLAITAGTFATANNTINAGTMTLNGGTFTPGSSSVYLSGTGTVFNYVSGTYTAGSETIGISDTSATAKIFAGGGQTYNRLSFAGDSVGDYIISGSNTFSELEDANTITHTIQFTAGTTTVVTYFTVSGTAGNVITIKSTSDGNFWNLNGVATTYNQDYLYIKDSHAGGTGAIWNPGSNSTDGTGNTGWNFFVPVYSVSITANGTITYGFLPASGTKDTTVSGLNTTPVATNNGNTTEKLNIKGTNTACPWTLAGTIGTDQYKHEFSTNGGSSYTPLTTSYQTLNASLAQSGTQSFDLKITMPSASACLTSQSPDVIVQAVAP